MASSATLSALFTAVSYLACRSWITSLGPLNTWITEVAFNVILYYCKWKLLSSLDRMQSFLSTMVLSLAIGWLKADSSLLKSKGLREHYSTQFENQNFFTVSADSCRLHAPDGSSLGYSHDGSPRLTLALLRRTISNAPKGEEGPKRPVHDDF